MASDTAGKLLPRFVQSINSEDLPAHGLHEGAEAPESPREVGDTLAALAGGCFKPLPGTAFLATFFLCWNSSAWFPAEALPIMTQVWV